MKAVLNSLRRFALTGLMVGIGLWPATDCGTIISSSPGPAMVTCEPMWVPVAPDVSGFVTDVLVKDNQQVQRGDVLFRIDRARYEIALKQAEAVLWASARCSTWPIPTSSVNSALTPGVVVSTQRMDQVVASRVRPRPAMTRPLPTLVLPGSTSSAARCAPPSMVSSPTWNCGRGPISRPEKA